MKILIPRNATLCEKFAATEFQCFTERITRKKLAITPYYSEDEKYFSIGNTELLKKNSISLDEQEYNLDGFIIKSIDGNVLLCGARDRGSLYAVYDYFERVYGVRFLTKDCTVIKEQEFVVPEIDVKSVPDFSIRNNRVWGYNESPLFATRSRSTPIFQYSQEFSPHLGGGLKRDYCDFGHNTLSIVSPTIYSKTHPEFFVWKDGRAVDLCWSNGVTENFEIDESMDTSVVKVVFNWIIEQTKRSSAKHFGVNMEDSLDNFCTCEKCRKVQERYKAQNATMIGALCALAKAVKKYAQENMEGREINLFTLVYNWSERPPVMCDETGKLYLVDDLLKFPDNLYVKLALMSADISRSFDDPKQTKNEFYDLNYRQVIEGWQLLDANFQSFDYSTNYYEYLWYVNYPPVLKKNLKYYKNELKMNYAEILGDYWPSYAGAFGDLKAYVASKLLWDMNTDIDVHTKEFCDGYYEEESETVYAFLQEMNEHIAYLHENTDYAVFTYLREWAKYFDARYYPKELLERQVERFEKAIERCKGNDILQQRLAAMIVIPLNMLRVNAKDYYGNESAELEFAKKYIDYCELAAMEITGEGYGLMQVKEGGPWLGGCKLDIIKKKYNYKTETRQLKNERITFNL